jgi:SAM-dependent methyltransferase
MTCRVCKSGTRTVLDLGLSPPANSLLESPTDCEETYPLVLERCDACSSLQLRDCLSASVLYRNYFYVTPDSDLLSTHYAQLYEHLAGGSYVHAKSFVLEVGSNVGQLLAYLGIKGLRVLGIDPAANICAMAQARGIETVCDFFNPATAAAIRAAHGTPDLIIARHCLAHNCDPHVMVAGAAELLDVAGHLVIENAYALNTVENNEFDQIYHEHMFYFSIRSMQALLARHGMHLVNVFMAPVHGGSVIFVAKRKSAKDRVSANVEMHLQRERRGLETAAFERFAANTGEIRAKLRALIEELVAQGKRIYTYGATAKGNTLLNYVGLTSRQLPRCVDSTSIKQGRYLPGSGIQVISEEQASADPPDYFLLTAWNYKDEIIAKVRRSGNERTQFIVPIPSVQILR